MKLKLKQVLKEEASKKKGFKPTPSLALYVEPMKGKFAGQGRKCENCIMWVKKEEACVIHDKEVHVTNDMVCGYHVPGEPLKEWMQFENIQPVKPNTSGLEKIGKEGSKCGNCVAFNKKKSTCYRVKDPVTEKDAEVEAQGCCALWEKK